MFLKLIFLTLFTQVIFANEILVSDNTLEKEILSSSEIYIDYDRNITFDSINTSDVTFKKNSKSILSFGYDPDFDVWIKFKLTNNTNQTIPKIIEYNNPLTTHVEFYQQKNKKYTKIQEGSFFIQKNRNSLNPIFYVTLNPKETKVYYIKVSSYITTLIVKLNLWEEKYFFKQEIKNQLVLTLFFGAMLLLALYNLLVYFFIKDISYLYYVLYVTGIMVHHSIYVGMTSLYIVPHDYVKYLFDFAMVIVTFPILALAFLTKYFLQVKKYPVWNKILNILLVVTFISIFVFVYATEYNNIRSVIPAILFIYLMCLTIYASIQRNRQAFIVLLGWVMLFIAGVSMYLSSLGIYNIYEHVPYIIEVVLISEALIFSVALTDKIKQLQKKKNEANMELILQKEIETIKLTHIVNKKTHNLKVALDEKELLLKELNHRVKNNMQTIVSLIRLQSKKIKDEKIKEMFMTIQNRINAMSHLHDLLYSQDNITYINAYDYFSLVVNELKKSYDNDIDINLTIETDLKVEQSVYCGLILNEMITNSFKYAFPNNIGKIDIYLSKIDDRYILKIEDNGIGYNSTTQTSTLGLILINTLSVDQLDGTIEVNSSNGVKVQITWK